MTRARIDYTAVCVPPTAGQIGPVNRLAIEERTGFEWAAWGYHATFLFGRLCGRVMRLWWAAFPPPLDRRWLAHCGRLAGAAVHALAADCAAEIECTELAEQPITPCAPLVIPANGGPTWLDHWFSKGVPSLRYPS